MSRSLFRKEAIDAQREKYLGETTLARPIAYWVYTLLAAAIASVLLAVAIWGEYTRRERVEGSLALDVGDDTVVTSAAPPDDDDSPWPDRSQMIRGAVFFTSGSTRIAR